MHGYMNVTQDCVTILQIGIDSFSGKKKKFLTTLSFYYVVNSRQSFSWPWIQKTGKCHSETYKGAVKVTADI